ncbi:aromatic acid exporter family protein [Fodinisporobacter ferrooxydans]|uniref:Aromatic acid exporter family protein n=1 Tax=Fodinisporobacter ferrooxydans TaxID=2901836 RepID=A0ABY4CRF8_9BACL|nr:aromatic acid exporter family protein [Alicyclobacillaceae bacterium MYW30-H2]
MVKIGYRTVKTAIGVFVSIFLAQWLGLTFPTAAGILTILSIQITRKRSLKNAYARFLACLLGLVFGFLFFKLFGYHPWSLLLLTLCFVPFLVKCRVQEGFVSAFVIVLHLYTVKTFTLAFLVNEVSIMGIGIGTGLLMNLYMPNIERDLQTYQQKIEENFRTIMKELAVYLKNHESMWDGKEMLETSDLINQAKSLAIRNVENHLLRNTDRYYHYFQMREEQFKLLERVVPLISTLSYSVPQGEKIADFLEHLSENIHPGNTAHIFLDQLRKITEEIKKTELPKTREEFEIRATLFDFLREMERYLLIKHKFRP